MVWTEDRIEKLKKLWGDGLSASQIAKQLGEVTRNAVIGKVHRLGLPARATGARATASRGRIRQPQARRAAINRPAPPRASGAGGSSSALRALLESDEGRAAPAAAIEEVVIPVGERKTLQDLTECMCRWPIGDPQLADFHFCGKDKAMGLPYCELHARRAFQPVLPKRRDRELPRPVAPVARVGNVEAET